MKFIFVLSKNRYRFKSLNNFGKNQKIGKYFIINLFSYFIFLSFFLKQIKNIYFISIDQCLNIDKKNSFNFWLTGTIQKIPSQYFNKKNYVNMKSVFHEKDQVFQLYPLKVKKSYFKKNRRLIYASTYEIKKKQTSNIVWQSINENVKIDFNLFDKKDFWQSYESDIERFSIYRDLKNFQRKQILEEILKNYNNKFDLYGDDWSKIFDLSHSNIEGNKIKKIYNGNLCIDLGSKCGSLTLYPRSIEIIENGGLLLQLKQIDSNEVFGQHTDRFTFDNFKSLNYNIERLLYDENFYKEQIEIQYDIFKNSKKKLVDQLDLIFAK
tara:strand:+ start:1771 stop:2739 length:969 start_codon:yes stop_codon:yes gene_type:complete